MKTLDYKKIIFFAALIFNYAFVLSQNCDFYNNLRFKNNVFDTIYDVKFTTFGKCGVISTNPKLTFNSAMGIQYQDCDLYIPIADDVLTGNFISKLHELYDIENLIKIQVRYYKNIVYYNKPLAVITKFIAYKKEAGEWVYWSSPTRKRGSNKK